MSGGPGGYTQGCCTRGAAPYPWGRWPALRGVTSGQERPVEHADAVPAPSPANLTCHSSAASPVEWADGPTVGGLRPEERRQAPQSHSLLAGLCKQGQAFHGEELGRLLKAAPGQAGCGLRSLLPDLTHVLFLPSDQATHGGCLCDFFKERRAASLNL